MAPASLSSEGVAAVLQPLSRHPPSHIAASPPQISIIKFLLWSGSAERYGRSRVPSDKDILTSFALLSCITTNPFRPDTPLQSPAASGRSHTFPDPRDWQPGSQVTAIPCRIMSLWPQELWDTLWVFVVHESEHPQLKQFRDVFDFWGTSLYRTHMLFPTSSLLHPLSLASQCNPLFLAVVQKRDQMTFTRACKK